MKKKKCIQILCCLHRMCLHLFKKNYSIIKIVSYANQIVCAFKICF